MHTNITGPTQDTPHYRLSAPRSFLLQPLSFLKSTSTPPMSIPGGLSPPDAFKNLQSPTSRSEWKSLIFSGPRNLTAGWCGPGTQNNRRETLQVGTYVPKPVLMHANVIGPTQNTPTWSERRRDCHQRYSGGLRRMGGLGCLFPPDVRRLGGERGGMKGCSTHQ
jgi:hypothetical protein